MPIADLGTTQQLHSFIAALQLGLESYFAGSVDHLRTTVYSDPVPGSHLRKQYLVLYDAVPGGTAYLRQLVTPDPETGALPLFVAFKRALKRIEGCPCWRDTERDGCYQCLYAYRGSRDMDDTSARAASELLRKILARKDKLQTIEHLSRISISGLMDSTLEARFVEALRLAKDPAGRAAKLKRITIGAKSGWLLTLGDAEWQIEPQVSPPKAVTGGIDVSIDFVLRPATARSDRQLAVFLDGWAFHRDRIGLDLRQRMALIAAGRWDVWSFSWWDLDDRLSSSGNRDRASVPELAVPNPRALKTILQQSGLGAYTALAEETTFDWLIRELLSAEGLPWPALARSVLASRMQHATPTHQRAWTAFVEQSAPRSARARLAALQPRLITLGSEEDHRFFQLMAIHDGDAESAVLCLLDDRPENLDAPEMRSIWQGYLRLFQWLRGLDNAWFMTAEALTADADYEPIAKLRDGALPDPAAWTALEDVESPYRPLAERLMAAGAPEPEIGVEIPNEHDETWSEAEMVWEARLIALTSKVDTQRAIGKPAAGWTIFYLEDLPEGTDGLGPDASMIIDALREKES